MDVLHQPYDSVMGMPSGRRKRFAQEKENLDRWIESKKRNRGGRR